MPSSSPSHPCASASSRVDVRVDLIEARDHDGVDVQPGAADAGVFVFAGRGIGFLRAFSCKYEYHVHSKPSSRGSREPRVIALLSASGD